MRIGDGLNSARAIQAYSSTGNKPTNKPSSANANRMRTSLGADTSSVSGVSLNTVTDASSGKSVERSNMVRNIKGQVDAGTYSVEASAILEASPQLLELVA